METDPAVDDLNKPQKRNVAFVDLFDRQDRYAITPFD
jgi:hypothetical protein